MAMQTSRINFLAVLGNFRLHLPFHLPSDIALFPCFASSQYGKRKNRKLRVVSSHSRFLNVSLATRDPVKNRDLTVKKAMKFPFPNVRLLGDVASRVSFYVHTLSLSLSLSK